MSTEYKADSLLKSFQFLLSTRIEYGDGVSLRAAEAVAQYPGNNVLVVTDAGIVEAGIAAPIIESLRQAGLDVVVFDEVEANPSTVSIDRAADLAREKKIEVIVAIGGGSSMDTAKGVAAVSGGGGRILDYEGLDKVPSSATPLIAIPTTAGTGSEVTMWSVITDPERRIKTAVGSPYIAPRMALLDPELTRGLPPSLTATTGIDALTHAIEAYTARCSNPVSDALALYAIELIAEHLEIAVKDGTNMASRGAMLLGSLLAGMAFGNSDTAAVHSMAEALGGMFNIPHGMANAICLPYVMGYNLPVVLERTARIGSALGLETGQHRSVLPKAKAAVTHVAQLISRLGIPTLADTGISRDDLPSLATKAFHNLGTPDNPRDIDEIGFERLFGLVFDAKDPLEAA